MYCFNNHKVLKTRRRHKSCPAGGVQFEFNNIYRADSQDDVLRKRSINLAKVVNGVHQNRACVPNVPLINSTSLRTSNENENTDIKSIGQLANYSHVAGGVHNSFHFQLEERIKNAHSSTGIPHQHKTSNTSDVNEEYSTTSGIFNSSHVPRKTSYDKTIKEFLKEKKISVAKGARFQFNQHFVEIEDLREQYTTEFELDLLSSDSKKADLVCEKQSGQLELNRIKTEGDILKVTDHKDNLVWSREHGKQCIEPRELADVTRLECQVYGTELLVESLANEVEETKQELTMSKRKQESDLSDLLLLNEELQTMWSEKESEVREILERFSTYRMAVEADSKEKEELYAEEILKRERTIKDLKCTKCQLEEKLLDKEATIEKLTTDIQEKENGHLKKFLEVNELVEGLKKVVLGIV